MNDPKDAGEREPSHDHQNTAGRRAMFPRPVRHAEKTHQARFAAAIKQVRAVIRDDVLEHVVERVADENVGGSIWPSEDGSGMEFIFSCDDESAPVIVTRNWKQIFCVSAKEDALKVLADLTRFIESRPEEDWHKDI